jgi:hypothetical protein
MHRSAVGAACVAAVLAGGVLAGGVLAGCVPEGKPVAPFPTVASDWHEKVPAVDPEPSPAASASSSPVSPVSPAGTGEPVLQVSYGTGFDPMTQLVPAVPDLTVYADGTAMSVPQAEEPFLPAVIPVLEVTNLGAARVQELLRAAADGGLLQADEGAPEDDDAPVPGFDWGLLTLTLTVDGTTYTHHASLLEEPEGVVAPEAEARVHAFIETQVVGLPLAGGAPYAPTAYAAAATFGILDSQGSDEPFTLPTWPLDIGLAELSTCRLLSPQDVATVQQTLDGEDDWGMWLDDGMPLVVSLRPLLPHEDACPV